MSAENQISRRDLVTNLGAGIAGAAITSAVLTAQAQTPNGSTSARLSLTQQQSIPSRQANRNPGQVSPVR
jgi:hypothetical protein